MRRIALGIVAAALLVPAAARAHDVPDGKECRNDTESSATVYKASTDPSRPNGSTEPDRLGVCLKANGMTVFYFGGEMQSEDPRNDGFMGTCGAVIVADQPVASGNHGEDWDRPGDGFHC
jgi:hypothetical protein